MFDTDNLTAALIVLMVANFLIRTCRARKAIELCQEGLSLVSKPELIKHIELCEELKNEMCLTLVQAYCVTNAIKCRVRYPGIQHDCRMSMFLAVLYFRQSKYVEAKELLEKVLLISTEIGDKKAESSCHADLGMISQEVGEYDKAKQHYARGLALTKQTGSRKAQSFFYRNLGTVLQSLNEYQRAKEHLEEAIFISKDIGDKKEEAFCLDSLGIVFKSLGIYKKAKECLEEALTIFKEIGARHGEGTCHSNLGALLELVREYQRAKEHYKDAIAISKELGVREVEASLYERLGTVSKSAGEFQSAKEYYDKALSISKDIGDRKGEENYNGILGNVCQTVAEYQKAKEYHLEALAISREIGDKKEEGTLHRNLGTDYLSVGEYHKAKQCFENALSIQNEIGDREGEQITYGNLGTLFDAVGEYQRARDYLEHAIAVKNKSGDRSVEAVLSESLGTTFQKLGKYQDAVQHHEKALAISREIGDRKLEAGVYGNLGIVFRKLGDYENAREYQEKALAISKETGDRARHALCCNNLGAIFQSRGYYAEAEVYYKSGLAISEEIGDVAKQFHFLDNLARLKYSSGTIQETLSYLALCIERCEQLRAFLGKNDQFKISFFHENIYPYHRLGALLCYTGKFEEALYVSELWRARALADLMSAGYFDENRILANHQSRVAVESVMDKELNCTCLYFFYFCEKIFLWILKAGRVGHFRKINGREILVGQGLVGDDDDLDEFFAMEGFRGFNILPREHGDEEPSKNTQREFGPDEKDCLVISRTGTENDKENDEIKTTLSVCYKLIIAPVVDLIDDPEIIIVPERSLYNLPFAALTDDTGKYLSETFRIRIVPSLTTLKLIQDSPADYHSHTGALIVGNPDVGRVRYKRRLKNISRLPYAEKEAIMVGGKLGVEPLLGKQATKQAVLQAIHSVGLIHFAAHGIEEEGEIVLAPNVGTGNKIPKEEDYLLTMSDIAKVRLRAKLVVLSCCHSARGQIKAEGVVGIARAFLGSGARSVLVALWRIQDSATERFMSRFYEHLVNGDSASESLHEAMKWMRCNGYSDVRQWAPFMLIGDNVTFDFRKK